MTEAPRHSVVIRADASIQIGTGHIMRCLTLADELTENGVKVQFICRNLKGHIGNLIEERGYELLLLTKPVSECNSAKEDPRHAKWLGVPWQQDANEVHDVLGEERIDWLIIDHYGIDARWHKQLRARAENIMVIDDLADRPLDCDLLLDQTYGRDKKNYDKLVPKRCKVKLGAKYALLRPEFSRLRPKALKKRQRYSGVENILVFMGGADPENITGQVVDTLAAVEWQQSPNVEVVLGGHAPHLSLVVEQAKYHELNVNVHVDVINMAELLFNADLAIGAGGTASWERCAMGLPSLITVFAENQRVIASMLKKAGAVYLWENVIDLQEGIEIVAASIENWRIMQKASADITDGLGCSRISNMLMASIHANNVTI